jgi:hypothetical protein
MDYIDSYGKVWSGEENDLDKFCRKNKLELVIEYHTNKETNSVYCSTRVRDKLGNYILNEDTPYPYSDKEVLDMIRWSFRNKNLKIILDNDD